MPQRNVASNFTFEQQRVEINNLAQDFWSQKGTVDTALPTFLKHDGTNNFTGQTSGEEGFIQVSKVHYTDGVDFI